LIHHAIWVRRRHAAAAAAVAVAEDDDLIMDAFVEIAARVK